MRSKILSALGALFLSACVKTPDGVTVVSDFELQRYLGTWYEIARLDHRFERGLENVTATYSLRDDGGVRVINRGFDPEAGEWDEAEGKAYFTGPDDRGALKVSFFGPFYGGYNIVALDDDYRWSLVMGPDRDYFWILSRTQTLAPETLDDLLERARAMGVDTEALIYPQRPAIGEPEPDPG